MVSLKKVVGGLICIIAVSVLFYSCGVSQKQLDEAEMRIKALEAKGVPDSILSAAKVNLYQARTSLKSSNSAYAKKYADSLFFYLEKAESKSQKTMEQYRPYVDSLRKTFDDRKKALSGLQLQYADSIIAYVDSFTNMGWLIQARDKAIYLDTSFARLVEDEKRSNKIRPRLIGTWSGQRVPPGGFKALEKRRFTFKKDGTFNSSEEMNGQTQETLKEYWKFLNWGTWKLRGDTILMFVEREKCPKQHFLNYVKKDGRLQWVKNQAPTYDSTIVGHGKDRFMTYEYLVDNFKKR